eukprot:GHVN01098984.1.p1 GENE.GHVN01098984.1~~GHVN01098984.1.p1  ORF type:complete len:102 (+),score=8.23 GHVN01098984.1:102-407(+)
MNQSQVKSTNFSNYVQMAQTGHYPLFFNDWLSSSLKERQPMSMRNASENVEKVFTTLERHRTLEKKKTALISMEQTEREEFIRSFFKVVEHEALKDIRSLQ